MAEMFALNICHNGTCWYEAYPYTGSQTFTILKRKIGHEMVIHTGTLTCILTYTHTWKGGGKERKK